MRAATWDQGVDEVMDAARDMDEEIKRERFEREQPRCTGCGAPIELAEDGWRDIDGVYECVDGTGHGPHWTDPANDR